MSIELLLLLALFITAPLEADGFSLVVSGLNLRPYEFFFIFLFVIALIRNRIHLDIPAIILILYAAVGIPGMINSVSMRDSAFVLVFTLFMVIISLTVRASIASQSRWKENSLLWVLGACNLINAFGLLQVITWALGAPISVQFHPELHPLYRVYSVFTEPNPYGNFLAAQCSILLVLWLTPAFKRWHKWILPSLLTGLFLLILNQSRGPWLGFAGAAAVYLFFHFLLRLRLPVKFVYSAVLGILVVVVVVVGMLAAAPTQLTSLVERLEDTINPLSEGAASARFQDIQMASEAISRNPVIGSGIGTWGAYSVRSFCNWSTEDCIGQFGEAVRNAPRNIIIGWLYEKGIIGLISGISTVILAIWMLVKILKHQDESIKASGWAYFCSWLALFIVFQFTFSEISPFHWINLGFFLAVYDRSRLP